MNDDPKYNSGTSLKRTNKEEDLDRLEALLWAEFSDHAYLQLKKVSIACLDELRKAVEQRLKSAKTK